MLIKKIKKSVFNLVVMLITFISMIALSLFAVSFSSILYILIFGVISLGIYSVGYIKNKAKEEKK